MIRGLYTTGWSMLAIEKKMDVITNNMANVDTTGYKKDTMIFESFPEVLTQRIYDTASRVNPSGIVGSMQLGSDVGQVYTYYNQGQLMNTGNNMDLAITDSAAAFFTVLVPDAEEGVKDYYTRNGSFMLGSDGRLITKDGYAVEGENGEIFLNGDDFSVTQDGTVIQDGQTVDRLLIKEFTDTTTLRKFGSNLLETTEESEEADFTGIIRQGYQERSNVNIVKEMVSMITVMRSYETNQKILQAQDGTLEKAVNEVGAIR